MPESITTNSTDFLSNQKGYIYSTESTSTAFAVGASVALIKPLGNKFTVILKADFYTASPKITITATSISANGVYAQTISDDKTFTNLGLTFGIGYKI